MGTKRSRNIRAHRASWILHCGPIPEGKWVLHCCPGRHIPFCVNPDHLYLGDAADNARDTSDQIKNGFLQRAKYQLPGESGHCKITKIQALEIREKYTGKIGEQNVLASEFGITQGSVWYILKGIHWTVRDLGPVQALTDKYERLAKEKARPRRQHPMRGEDSPAHKLTWEQVREIRQKYSGKRGQQSELAREYHVRQNLIWMIVNHLIWKEQCAAENSTAHTPKIPQSSGGKTKVVEGLFSPQSWLYASTD